VQSALTIGVRGVGRIMFRWALRRLAVEINAPVTDSIKAADLNLGVWPEWFCPPAPDDPPRSRMCGFVFDIVNASAPIAPDIQTFLAAGDAPVVVGFGSAASLHAADRYRAVAKACEKLGRRCLLIGPSANVVAPTQNVMAVASAPYARVFPSASVVVHHGGFGTCGEVLRAGKPSLVMPFGFDQFDIAARLQDARLGTWLAGNTNNVEMIAAALDSTLRNASLRAAAHDAALKISAAPNGADRAAELIETVKVPMR
jgi:rhamnosyltransferase subunit B